MQLQLQLQRQPGNTGTYTQHTYAMQQYNSQQLDQRPQQPADVPADLNGAVPAQLPRLLAVCYLILIAQLSCF